MKDLSILQRMIAHHQWQTFQPMMDRIQAWPYWNDFVRILSELKRDKLYQSPVHGQGHIERVLLHGAFCAMEQGLTLHETLLLLDACCYHDVGRINDWQDPEHGYRSAQRMAELTGRSGQELLMLKAMVDAHSRHDSVLESTLQSYQPQDYATTLKLAKLLKDADGLDRVRIHDLNTRYMRFPTSAKYADFALYLFACYQLYYAMELPFSNHNAIGMELEINAPEMPTPSN